MNDIRLIDRADGKAPIRWQVWDNKDKRPVGKPYNDKKRARRRVDKLDNDYGAYRYTVIEHGSITKEM